LGRDLNDDDSTATGCDDGCELTISDSTGHPLIHFTSVAVTHSSVLPLQFRLPSIKPNLSVIDIITKKYLAT